MERHPTGLLASCILSFQTSDKAEATCLSRETYGCPARLAYLAASFHFTWLMLSSLRTSLGRLRVVGFLEGISFLVLLGIAMPLKYLFGQPEAVRIVGMAHGVLFVAYVLLVLQVSIERSWSWKKALLALAVSVVPFGTFWAEKKLFQE
jgi:integral membrane protein